MAKPMGLPYGPYPLTGSGVKVNVLRKSPGAYALGNRGADGIFYIDYIGRSDDDIANRLQQHTPERYPQFHYTYCESVQAAYAKECQLYHDFNPVDNKVHPATPRSLNLACPICGQHG